MIFFIIIIICKATLVNPNPNLIYTNEHRRRRVNFLYLWYLLFIYDLYYYYYFESNLDIHLSSFLPPNETADNDRSCA